MKIAYPVTDYIPASLLTTMGDLVTQGLVNLERLGVSGANKFLQCHNGGAVPSWTFIGGLANTYLKGGGAGASYIAETLALRDTGIHIGYLSRNAGGNQIVSTVPFEPSLVVFLACDDVGANQNWSIGFDTVVLTRCMHMWTNGTLIAMVNGNSISIVRNGANHLIGNINSIEADGFIFAWTLLGACVVNVIYLCFP